MNSHKNSRFPSRFLANRLLAPQIFFAPDDGVNNPGGDNSNPPATNPPAGKSVAEQVSDEISRLLGKNNDDPNAAMTTLIKQNYALQKRADAAESKVGKLPDEIQTELDSFRALGNLNELTNSLNSGRAAIAERDAFRKSAALETAAKVAGFKPGVLKLLGKDLDVEVREVEVQKEDGTSEKRQSAFVKQKDSTGVESQTPLRDYFKGQGEDVLGLLEAVEEFSNGAGTPQLPPQGGTPYPQQSAGAGATAGYKPQNRYEHHVKTE